MKLDPLHIKSIINSESDSIIASDESMNILFWNKAAEAMFGYSQDEIIGKSIATIIPKRFHEMHNNGMSRMNSGGSPKVIGKSVEIYGLKKNGEEFPIELTLGHESQDGRQFYSSIIRDISERKQLEKEMIEQNMRFLTISNSKTDAIITSDSTMSIRFWNSGAEQIFGYSKDEILGKSISVIIPDKLKSTHERSMSGVIKGNPHSVIGKVVELEGLRKNGEQFPIELTLGAWESGDKKYFSGIIRDITERKAAEKLINEQNRLIKIEKERNEQLLHNILPKHISAELLERGEVDAKTIEDVAVLFTDFSNFTEKSSSISAQTLVLRLNQYFREFDTISRNYKLEKIKTIGDSYMAAGGLQKVQNYDVTDIVKAAIEMVKAVENINNSEEQPTFSIRVGIHIGKVVAGVVGHSKFQYDIWGDTVNTASRMESSSQPGKINISMEMYQLVKNDKTLSFESRGKVQSKGKGALEMYFVDKAK